MEGGNDYTLAAECGILELFKDPNALRKDGDYGLDDFGDQSYEG